MQKTLAVSDMRTRHGSVQALAWGAALLTSLLPDILFREITGGLVGAPRPGEVHGELPGHEGQVGGRRQLVGGTDWAVLVAAGGEDGEQGDENE